MLQHSKSLRTIRARTEEFCDKAKKKFSFSFKNDRDGKKNSNTSSTKSSFNKGNKDSSGIFIVIEDYKALSQSHISVSKGQKVILLPTSTSNEENVNVSLLPSENFLSPTNDTGIQGLIPKRILACIDNENKG
uniref:SH3 domain-containing protein n=1 Tax=Parastrongyloides trichosuri TaxID=131310 RepID=A0A0N4ZES9_PARTI